jgi:hypothetical protein
MLMGVKDGSAWGRVSLGYYVVGLNLAYVKYGFDNNKYTGTVVIIKSCEWY